MPDKSKYAPTVLRLVLALLFIIPGLSKLTNPSMVTQMLSSLGFVAPVFFTWLLIFSEIIFGLALILGYKLKYTVWPLVIILFIGIIKVYIPTIVTNPTGIGDILFHVLGIAALISLALTGPGAWAIKKK